MGVNFAGFLLVPFALGCLDADPMKLATANRLLWLISVAAEIAVLIAFVLLISMLWGKLPLPHGAQFESSALLCLEACVLMFGVNVALALRREQSRGCWGIARCAFYFVTAMLIFPAFACA